MNLLETTHLTKTYNDRKVVDEVSFVLHQQEVVGLLGRNGAGKTTTFRMILGMVAPDSGAVTFDGQDITHLPMYKRARRGIGYLAQDRSDFRRLTVWQNLMAILETLRLSYSERKRRAEQLLSQYGLTKNRNQMANTLSGGERRKMEIARALVTDPKLILLDEPFAGVDPIAKEELSLEVRRLKDEFRKTVLITDHDVAFTLKVLDRALIIDAGQVKFQGTPRETINDPGVRSAYLGNTFRGDEFDDPAEVARAARQPAAQQQPAAQRPAPVKITSPAPAAPAAAASAPAVVPAASSRPLIQPTLVPQPAKPAAPAAPARPAAAAPAPAKPAAPVSRPAPRSFDPNPSTEVVYDEGMADIFSIGRPQQTPAPAQPARPAASAAPAKPAQPAPQQPAAPAAATQPAKPAANRPPQPTIIRQVGGNTGATFSGGSPITGSSPVSPFAKPPPAKPAPKQPAPPTRPPEQF